jgi:hypothetical protein
MMIVTIDPRLCGIRVRRVSIFGDESKRVTFVNALFFVIGFWRDSASVALLQAVKNVDHNPEWIFRNWNHVRLAKKKAIAKGRAEGKAEVYPWKVAYEKQYERASSLESENWRLRTTIETLQNLESQKGSTG